MITRFEFLTKILNETKSNYLKCREIGVGTLYSLNSPGLRACQSNVMVFQLVCDGMFVKFSLITHFMPRCTLRPPESCGRDWWDDTMENNYNLKVDTIE